VLRDRAGPRAGGGPARGKPWRAIGSSPAANWSRAESPFRALQRELQEELGIRVRAAYRLLPSSIVTPDRKWSWDVWRVTCLGWRPHAHEGQRLAWHAPTGLRDINLLPADEPIVRVLEFAALLLVTPAPGR